MEVVCLHGKLEVRILVINEDVPQLPDLSVPINKNKRIMTKLRNKNTKKSPPAMVGWWTLSNVFSPAVALSRYAPAKGRTSRVRQYDSIQRNWQFFSLYWVVGKVTGVAYFSGRAVI